MNALGLAQLVVFFFLASDSAVASERLSPRVGRGPSDFRAALVSEVHLVRTCRGATRAGRKRVCREAKALKEDPLIEGLRGLQICLLSGAGRLLGCCLCRDFSSAGSLLGALEGQPPATWIWIAPLA